jgi:hypothetical protein
MYPPILLSTLLSAERAPIQVIAGPKAGIIEHSVDGSDWVK